MSTAKEIYDCVQGVGSLAKQGFPNGVERVCNEAEERSRQILKGDELSQMLDYISRMRGDYLATAQSIKRDKEIVSRFNWRRPNSRESWIAAELGYDPFPQPTEEERREIYDARARLRSKGIHIDTFV